jgi:hypothetical protein
VEMNNNKELNLHNFKGLDKYSIDKDNLLCNDLFFREEIVKNMLLNEEES